MNLIWHQFEWSPLLFTEPFLRILRNYNSPCGVCRLLGYGVFFLVVAGISYKYLDLGGLQLFEAQVGITSSLMRVMSPRQFLCCFFLFEGLFLLKQVPPLTVDAQSGSSAFDWCARGDRLSLLFVSLLYQFSCACQISYIR